VVELAFAGAQNVTFTSNFTSESSIHGRRINSHKLPIVQALPLVSPLALPIAMGMAMGSPLPLALSTASGPA